MNYRFTEEAVDTAEREGFVPLLKECHALLNECTMVTRLLFESRSKNARADLRETLNRTDKVLVYAGGKVKNRWREFAAYAMRPQTEFTDRELLSIALLILST